MTDLPRHIPVGTKVFGLALSMLVLLIILSIFTSNRVNQVSNELIEISDFLIPLESSLIEIERRILQQEILFEQLLRIRKVQSEAPNEIEPKMRAFDHGHTKVLEEIENAVVQSTKALDHVQARQDIIEFARLQVILKQIEQEYHELHQSTQKRMNVQGKGQIMQVYEMEKVLEKEERDLNRKTDDFRKELERLTERSARETEEHEDEVLWFSQALTGFAAIIGLLFAAQFTMQLMKPIQSLIQGTKEIELGNMDIQVDITSNDEIGELTRVFNSMVHEIKEKERIKSTFGQFLDPRIVDRLTREVGDHHDIGEKQVMTVFFRILPDSVRLVKF